MNRVWSGAAAIVLLGVAQSSGHAQDKPRPELVTPRPASKFVLPGSKPAMVVVGDNIVVAKPGEVQITGNVVITLRDGVRLHIPQSPVRIVFGAASGGADIFIEPLPIPTAKP